MAKDSSSKNADIEDKINNKKYRDYKLQSISVVHDQITFS